jgi:hypothetical protein
MGREKLHLESWRFTRTSAFVREVLQLLEDSDYSLILHVRGADLEEISHELESCRTFGRVKLEVGLARLAR